MKATEVLLFVNVTKMLGLVPESTESTYAADPTGNTNNTTVTGATTPFSFLCNQSSSSEVEELNFYLNGVSNAVVIALGIVGNVMAMIVLTRRAMRTSTNCFLTALAIWDTVVLLVALPLISLPELSPSFQREVFPYIVVYAYPVALAAQMATVWLTVSFTVERYIAVCHPLRAASMCTIPRARMVVLVISAVSLLYNVPRWFEYTIVKATDAVNATCIFPGKTPLANDSIYHKIYFGWLYFLVMCFIPLCSLAVLNAFLVFAVRHSQQQRKDMNVRQSRENNVTIMLVSVVMVFIICQVPALIYNMAYAINMVTVMSSLGWIILSNIRNFLVTLNSAINFILYCALGQKFRRTFVRTFCPWMVKRMPGRFQSFSFNHNADSTHRKSLVNGNAYSKVIYQKCQGGREDDPSGLGMKVLSPKYSPRESTESNGSGENPDIFDSKMSQHSQKKLLSIKGTKPD